jgi:putative SOS response-associated peptidase YedK
VRAEGRIFPTHRCLIVASDGDRKFRTRSENGNFFYVAGIWESAMGDWPIGYRNLTVDANPEVMRYQARHSAIIHRRQVMQRIDLTVAETGLLVTPPAHLSTVTEIDAKPVHTMLAL